jgi:hypothetical protein
MGYIIGIAAVAAWLTHVVTCLAAGAWGYLIAGALIVPIAVIHGIMIWFGAGAV